MRTLKFSALAVLTAMFFTACGDDVTQVTQETSGLEVVASADSLGKCTAERSGEMKFASKENSVYVCADSSWKNVSAVENVSCSAETLKDSSGFKIVCDGDSVGVVFNGNDGKKGEVGKAGTSCTVTESPHLDSDFGGGYFVVCGSDTVGMLVSGRDGENCSLTDNGDGTVTQVCGASEVTLYKAFCGGKAYEPEKSFCYEDSVVARCGGESYDLSESFCLGDSIYALCGGDPFNPEEQFCFNDSIIPLCNGVSYSLDSSFCYGDSIVALCGGEIYSVGKDVCVDEKVYKNKALVWEKMNPEIDYEVFTDERDGQVYRTVRIGEQIWMAENLNYAYMPDTLSFCYNDLTEYCEKRGRLYMWSAAMDSAARFSDNGKDCGDGKTCSPTYPVRGICPEGWHLPIEAEWDALRNFIAKQMGDIDAVGYALKSTNGWKDNGNGSDAFGFGAFPAGYRVWNGQSCNVVGSANFLGATEYSADFTLSGWLRYNFTNLMLDKSERKKMANSIRCIKD